MPKNTSKWTPDGLGFYPEKFRFVLFFLPCAKECQKESPGRARAPKVLPQSVQRGSPGRPGAPKVAPNGTKIATEGCFKRPKTSSILSLH